MMRPLLGTQRCVGNILARPVVMNFHSLESACAHINSEVASTSLMRAFLSRPPMRCPFAEESRKPVLPPCGFTIECDEVVLVTSSQESHQTWKQELVIGGTHIASEGLLPRLFGTDTGTLGKPCTQSNTLPQCGR